MEGSDSSELARRTLNTMFDDGDGRYASGSSERLPKEAIVSSTSVLRAAVQEEIVSRGLRGAEALARFYELVDTIPGPFGTTGFGQFYLLSELVAAVEMAGGREGQKLTDYEKKEVARLQQTTAFFIVFWADYPDILKDMFSDIDLFCELSRMADLGETADRFRHGIIGMVSGMMAFQKCGLTVTLGDALKDDVREGIDFFVTDKKGLRKGVDVKCWKEASFMAERDRDRHPARGERYVVYIPQPEIYPEYFTNGYLPNEDFIKRFKDTILPTIFPQGKALSSPQVERQPAFKRIPVPS
jgi:hypothetical protein